MEITERILRLPEVKALTGLSRSTIYLYIHKGLFPSYVNLGDRAVGWSSNEVQKWISSKIEETNKNMSGA